MRIERRRRDVPAEPAMPDVAPVRSSNQATSAEKHAAKRLYEGRHTARPAFYALARGGWRDYITLLHPPYTLWHLGYVVLGAAVSPHLHEDRLAATLVAFFLAVGVAAHALDELNGRPLRTGIPRTRLMALTIGGLSGAVIIGVAGAVLASPWLLAFVLLGAFIAPAYNLEWFRGRFHTDLWFALAWGVFPFLTAYFASAEEFGFSAVFGATGVFALSMAQRTLSRRVRNLRRQMLSIEGRIVYVDGSVEDIDRRWALSSDERSLMLMAAAIVALSVSALLSRL